MDGGAEPSPATASLPGPKLVGSTWCTQLQVLLWKHSLAATRQWRGTLGQLITPILVVLGLIGLQAAADVVLARHSECAARLRNSLLMLAAVPNRASTLQMNTQAPKALAHCSRAMPVQACQSLHSRPLVGGKGPCAASLWRMRQTRLGFDDCSRELRKTAAWTQADTLSRFQACQTAHCCPVSGRTALCLALTRVSPGSAVQRRTQPASLVTGTLTTPRSQTSYWSIPMSHNLLCTSLLLTCSVGKHQAL